MDYFCLCRIWFSYFSIAWNFRLFLPRSNRLIPTLFTRLRFTSLPIDLCYVLKTSSKLVSFGFMVIIQNSDHRKLSPRITKCKNTDNSPWKRDEKKENLLKWIWHVELTLNIVVAEKKLNTFKLCKTSHNEYFSLYFDFTKANTAWNTGPEYMYIIPCNIAYIFVRPYHKIYS